MEKRVARCNHLLAKIKRGDEKALEKLFEEYGGGFLNIARFYLVDKDYAEDLLSEVFVEIVRTEAQMIDETKNGLNLIWTMIKRKAYRHNKKSAGENTVEEIDEKQSLAFCIADDTVDKIALRHAIEQLSDEENKILFMKFWQGFTVREIAKKLDKSRSGVQYIIDGAIKKLRALLEEEDPR